jgi:MtN3 and saliva related transmembrane protein
MTDFTLFEFNNTETELIFGEVFGWSAGILCFSILVPQIVHTWKVKSTDDLSIGFLILNEICTLLYVFYGLIIGSSSIVVCDFIIFLLNTSLIISKVILDKRKIQGNNTVQAKDIEMALQETKYMNPNKSKI